MRNILWFMLICSLFINMTACKGKSGEEKNNGSKAELKTNPAEDASNRALALAFLQGLQNGDKNKMYEAANLTPEIVADSREKLIHIKQNKLNDQQRLGFEHALRVSGNIDFFISKLGTMFPKSSAFHVTITTTKEASADTKHFIHAVTITYNDQAEAIHDKTGKTVKSMAVLLQQIDREVGARLIHEFSFDSKDFEKMADRDFEVISYF